MRKFFYTNAPRGIKASRGWTAIVFAAGLIFVASFTFRGGHYASSSADPADSLEIAPGLKAHLFAGEPMLVNPTDIDIDEKGRVWVCEVVNYRPESNPDMPERKEGDRILILEDTTGDGRADVQKVFYQGNDINAALGIMVLGNKVILSVSPNVIMLTDTDGDDKADKKEYLLTGVGGIQSDHSIHAFTFGPDGKFYFNFGNAGKQILDKNGQPLTDQAGNIIADNGKPYRDGMVFRCDTDGTHVEVLAYNFRNNYEVAVDSYGTLWQSDNDDDGNRSVRINYVMQYGNFGFKDEMTGATWRTPRTNMEAEIPRRHWHQDDPGVVPNLLITGAGSPTGILVYEGNLLPAVFQNQLIHADAGPNVVRAYSLQEDGAGFKADSISIVRNKVDKRFRPSDVCVAPDGSLIVADWYDPGVGGHRMRDIDNGRLYRIAPPGAPYRFPKPDLSTPATAVLALKSPNLSTRYLAWRQLHAWSGKSEKALSRMFKKDLNPRFRARALWLLSLLPGKKGKKYIEKAIGDKNADIRITGLRAAQELKMDLIPYLAKLAKDPSSQVRREAAIHLRYTQSPVAPQIWATLASGYDGRDRWYLEALGIGAELQWAPFFSAWLKENRQDPGSKAFRDIVWRARTPEAMALLHGIITHPSVGTAERPRYFRALDFYPASLSKHQLLIRLLNANHPRQEEINALALAHIDPGFDKENTVIKTALKQVLQNVRGQIDFVRLVDRFNVRDQDRELLRLTVEKPDSLAGLEASKVLLQNNPTWLKEQLNLVPETAVAAVLKAIGGYAYADTKGQDLLESLLLNNHRSLQIRRTALNILGHNRNGEEKMLRLLKEKKLAGELQEPAARLLSRSSSAEIRAASAGYYTATITVKPRPSIDKLVAIEGNAINGKAIFFANCSVCHKVNNAGTDFGPELSEIGNKLPKPALYDAILYTDAGISLGYEGYEITLKDNTQVEGIVANETKDKLDMRFPGGAVLSYPIKNIVARQKLNRSLMPASLYESLSEKDLVDLVEYLGTLKKAGNQ